MENKGEQKKSLMESLKNLSIKANALEKVNNLSWQVLNKVTNPNPKLLAADKKTDVENKDMQELNLIELFDNELNKIERQIKAINDNLNKLLIMIG